jgi:16S rRNA (guanine966-N2)-methyltransferase
LNNNQCRIIGGRWRGRRISFPEVPGLRPTGDRLRETLFNWLQNDIQDAVCLDVFAGSGVLGFEALSRGAASVTFVDQSPLIIKHLQTEAEKLSAIDVTFLCDNVPSSSLLKKLASKKFSLVFLDPPFHQGWVEKSCGWLAGVDILANNTLIYIEAERELFPLPIPENWEVLKSKFTGQVGYHLIKRT